MEAATMDHRGIDYDIKLLAPGKWRWTIYPEPSASRKVVGTFSHATHELADTACTAEIDRTLDMESDAPPARVRE
jgi:hypothetical protein